MHDLGKYLFAFSIFWAYLWLSQYLLIWYSNIPEETIYYLARTEHFNGLFFLNLALNFLVPLLALMTRNSKRQTTYLAIVALIVLLGHYLDLYIAIVPGAVGHEAAKIGFLEIGLPLFYLAVFLTIFFIFFAKIFRYIRHVNQKHAQCSCIHPFGFGVKKAHHQDGEKRPQYDAQ